MENKFLSRKLLMTVYFSILAAFLPITFKINGISETVTMAVLGIIGTLTLSYQLVQGQVDKEAAKNDDSPPK